VRSISKRVAGEKVPGKGGREDGRYFGAFSHNKISFSANEQTKGKKKFREFLFRRGRLLLARPDTEGVLIGGNREGSHVGDKENYY